MNGATRQLSDGAFTLSAEDMGALDAPDQTGGTDRAQENKWWR